MKFSSREKKDLFFAGVMISLAFAILLSGGFGALTSINLAFLLTFVIAFFTAGLGFLLHEMMHKYVAQSYGLFSEFRAYYIGLYVAVFFSLFGFIFAAPGAVVIRSYSLSKEKNGKISLAGPATNIVLAFVFLSLLLIFGKAGFLGSLFGFGLTINSLLAAFNMIPILPFDGVKILWWNKGIYYTTLIVAIGLYVGSWWI